MSVAFAARAKPVTLMFWPLTASVPELTVVQPIALVATGAVQPLGTATETSPLGLPKDAAVYVNTTVLRVELADTFVVVVAIVPAPSEAAVKFAVAEHVVSADAVVLVPAHSAQ